MIKIPLRLIRQPKIAIKRWRSSNYNLLPPTHTPNICLTQIALLGSPPNISNFVSALLSITQGIRDWTSSQIRSPVLS